MEKALQNLLLPEYAAIKDLFGDVLAKRRKKKESDCFIFRLLALNQTHELGQLSRDCSVYIRELGLDEAQKKCRHEVMGDVKRPPDKFNQRCGAFWAEMAAVRVLAEDGFHRFRPIKNEQDKRSSDYHAYREQVPAYIEVKNLNANDTVFDFLIQQIREAYERDPSAYGFHLVLEYAYDDPPTREQERIISNFISQIGGRKPPFREALDLVKGPARIEVMTGEGTAGLVRGVGGDWPEAVDYEWLLDKVWRKALDARPQIPDGDHLKVLVINVDTTNAVLDLDFVQAAKQKIRDVFGGDVQPYVLHFRYLVQIPSRARNG